MIDRSVAENVELLLVSVDAEGTILCANLTAAEAMGRTAEGLVGASLPELIPDHADVTERTRLQRQLARKEKLASLGLMARGVAHDFNNLLTSIMGNVGLGKLRAANGSDLGLVFNEIESASRRAAALCEEMMIYGGKTEPTRESGDLGLVIDELVPLTRAHANADIELHCEVPATLPLVACSRVALGQVILNLVNNAADVIGGVPGRVTITAEPVELEDSCDSEYLPARPGRGNYVRLRVADTGAGIDLQERARAAHGDRRDRTIVAATKVLTSSSRTR